MTDIKPASSGLEPCPLKGDYVLATKFHDGDFADPWAIGFYTGRSGDRHFVADSDGNQIRYGGFRRVAKISTDCGNWLYANRVSFEQTSPHPETFNLWMLYSAWQARTPTVTDKDSGGVYEEVYRYVKDMAMLRHNIVLANDPDAPFTAKEQYEFVCNLSDQAAGILALLDAAAQKERK